MKVRLISYSKPTREIYTEGLMDAQDLVAFCARVSNPANQYNTDTSDKLIRYLIKNKHWSPLEMVSACVEVETTRDIARQFLRHRSFSFQEFSQRYADPAVFENQFVLREARYQDDKNRQNSVDMSITNDKDRNIMWQWERQQQIVIDAAKNAYQWAIDRGIAKEQARCVLPEGNTVSRLYVNGTLRSWVHYIELRSSNGTQKEHAEIAKTCANVISEVFPMSNEFITE